MSAIDGPEIWQAACSLLEQSVVPTQVKTWIQPLQWVSAEPTASGLTVTLSAAKQFNIDWVNRNPIKDIESALTQTAGVPCSLNLVLQSSEITESARAAASSLRPETTEETEARSGTVQNVVLSMANRNYSEIALDPRYTFSTFIVGASNQFAHASAIAVAERPATQYNPLFIYSPPGLGKTHLLHAVGNHLLSKNPSTRVGYFSAETFANEFIESIQRGKMMQFRAKYRDGYDVLLIDDIQFIAGRQKTEEEFFHTFNALHGTRRQIVLTSDRPPKEIDGLEDRIRTRFEWGLVTDIQVPEIETRIAILKNKAERDDIYLPDDVATFIASHVRTNVRELEGLLIRLQAQASLSGAEISLEMAKQELKLSLPEEGSLITVETIQNVVARHFQIKIQDLKSTARNKTVALPRQIAMFLVRKYTGLGLKDIGQFFGGKDHTTIIHACNKIEQEMESRAELRQVVESIQNQL
jgi:chromosomal replication initiator protein